MDVTSSPAARYPRSIMKLGLIGCGKMGKAFLRGALTAKVVEPDSTFVCCRTPGTADDLIRDFNISETQSILELIDKTNVILIAVKPKDMSEVLRALSMGGAERHLLISVAAGIPIHTILEQTSPGTRVARVMPNTPVMIGKGASAYCMSGNATPADEKAVAALLNATGLALKVDESLINSVIGISGSGPAYMFMILEAMSDAGVLCGLPRDTSLKLAAHTMLGAASMVIETGIHPAILREQVTSPGGTTIAGLAKMEELSVRHAMIEAASAATRKAVEMDKSYSS